MFDSLMTAMIQGDNAEVLRLLKLVPEDSLFDFLQEVDDRGYNLIHHLALFDQVEALNYLLPKVPRSLFTQVVKDRSPFMLAIEGNATRVVGFFEKEGLDKFASVVQREVFLGNDVDALLVNPRDLVSNHSPLLAAVAAGNVKAATKLLLHLLVILQDEPAQCTSYLFLLFDLAVRNKHENLLSLLTTCIDTLCESEVSQQLKLNWLKGKETNYNAVKRALQEKGKPKEQDKPKEKRKPQEKLASPFRLSGIEKIEKNFADPVKALMRLFPVADNDLKERLIMAALQKTCTKILKSLLTELKVDDQTRRRIIFHLARKAIQIFSDERYYTAQFFTSPDVLNLAANVCVEDFNKWPDLLAIALRKAIEMNDDDNSILILDVFLKRVTDQARLAAVQYEFTDKVMLGHIAVKAKAIGSIIVLNQKGASYDLKCKNGLTVRTFASQTAKAANTTRTASVKSLEKRLKKITGRKKSLNEKQLADHKKAKEQVEQELKEARELSVEELLFISMDQIGIHRKFTQQNIYFHIGGKLIDGITATTPMINLLVDTVKTIREMNAGSEETKGCVQGLWKAMVAIVKSDLGVNARGIQDLLSEEIDLLDPSASQFTTLMHFTMFEYALFLENIPVALHALDNISTCINLQKARDVFSEALLPQMIVSRVPLVFFQVLGVKIPDNIKLQLRESSQFKAALRIAEHESGFTIQAPIALLDFAEPRQLTRAELIAMGDLLLAFKNDKKHYKAISLSDEYCQSAIFKKIAARTYINLKIFLSWLQANESKFCPGLLDLQKQTTDELKDIQLFLNIKAQILRMLGHAAMELDQFLKKPKPSSLNDEFKEEHEKVTTLLTKVEKLLPAQEVVLTTPPINPLLIWAIGQKDNKIVMRQLEIMQKEFLLLEYQDPYNIADFIARKLVDAGLSDSLTFLQNKIKPRIIAVELTKPESVHESPTNDVATALQALRAGRGNVAMELLAQRSDKNSRIEFACELLTSIATEIRFCKAMKDSRIVIRIARLIANDLSEHIAQVNQVVRVFYANDQIEALREFLSNLPLTVTSAAINHLPTEVTFPPTLSLLYTAIIERKNSYWYLFVAFGGNLEQKCHAQARSTLKQLIEQHQKMGGQSFSIDLLNAEQHARAFVALTNKLIGGEILTDEEIALLIKVNQTLTVKYQTLNQLIVALWDVLKWCCENNADNTNFDSAFRFAEALVKAAVTVRPDDYLRLAALAFALGKYNTCLEYVDKYEEAMCKNHHLSKLVRSELTTTKLLLIMQDALNICLPSTLKHFYLTQWDVLCEAKMVGQGFLPFITGSELAFSEQILSKLNQQLLTFKKRTDKRDVTEQIAGLKNNEITCFELSATNEAILRLLRQIYSVLKTDRSTEVKRLFYLAAEKIIFILKQSMAGLEQQLPNDLTRFVEKINNLASSLGREKLTAGDAPPAPPMPEKKVEAKSKAKDEKTGEKVVPKRNISGYRYVSPEELFATVPPLTYMLAELSPSEEEKPVKKVDEKVIEKKHDAKKHEARRPDKRHKPKNTTAKIILDVTRSPTIPSIPQEKITQDEQHFPEIVIESATIDPAAPAPDPAAIDPVPQAELGITDIAETGLTFIENALIKARHAAKESGLPALADDSGLAIAALNGAPGIYSSRYAGEPANSKNNIAKILTELANVSNREAEFYCVLAFLLHADDPTPLICEGKWQGSIMSAPTGQGGFGYDPIFYVPDQKKSAAELTSEVKNHISHRAKALQTLLQLLPEKLHACPNR